MLFFALIPAPSDVFECKDLSSCFQALYNFFFALLIALAFLNFLYGAFLYLLSGAKIYSQDEGKKKMKNSIIAIIVALTIPIVLNMINPEIFNVVLKIPEVKVQMPVSLDDVEISEIDLNLTPQSPGFEKPTRSRSIPLENSCEEFRNKNQLWKCDAKNMFGIPAGLFKRLSNISFANNDNGTEYINPALEETIREFDKKLKEEKIKIIITEGYSPCTPPKNGACPPGKKLDEGKCCDHKAACHRVYGTCIDVVVRAPLTDPSWDRVKEIARSVGFYVLDERYEKGSKFSKGAHLHLDARK
jgi:hypothetical protein